MDINEFIRKNCTEIADLRSDTPFGNTIFQFNLKLNLCNLWWDRRFAHNLGYNDGEVNLILKEEQLQHPIIAMQEASKKMCKLQADLMRLQNSLFKEWTELWMVD